MKDILPLWWSFFWRWALYIVLSDALLGLILGLSAPLFGVEPEAFGPYFELEGIAVVSLLSIVALRQALDKCRWSSQQPAAPENGRTTTTREPA